MAITVLNSEQLQTRLLAKRYPAQETYYAMYSTWLDGIITDPSMMLIPVDDHMVHRGDGVFEALKMIEGKIFLLDEHLQRLAISAEQISLPLPMTLPDLKKIIIETTTFTQKKDALLRLYVSRGPGGFTTNPYETVASQVYLVITSFKPVSEDKYAKGVSIGKSHIPAKDPWFARIKSCNYLQNVLMKKESVDRGLEFTIGFDDSGFVTESSTENIVIVDKDKNLVHPKLHNILKGTTMVRTFNIAQELVKEGLLKSLQERDISEDELISASEIMMIGTTLDILPVSNYEGIQVGTGKPGPVVKKLLKLLREDIKNGPKSTLVFG